MSERTIFRAFITKYALTQGILEKEVEDCFHVSPDMVSAVDNEWREHYHGEGKDWHRTKEGAVKRAETMRAAKIASLKKQIARLENLTFD